MTYVPVVHTVCRCLLVRMHSLDHVPAALSMHLSISISTLVHPIQSHMYSVPWLSPK